MHCIIFGVTTQQYLTSKSALLPKCMSVVEKLLSVLLMVVSSQTNCSCLLTVSLSVNILYFKLFLLLIGIYMVQYIGLKESDLGNVITS